MSVVKNRNSRFTVPSPEKHLSLHSTLYTLRSLEARLGHVSRLTRCRLRLCRPRPRRPSKSRRWQQRRACAACASGREARPDSEAAVPPCLCRVCVEFKKPDLLEDRACENHSVLEIFNVTRDFYLETTETC